MPLVLTKDFHLLFRNRSCVSCRNENCFSFLIRLSFRNILSPDQIPRIWVAYEPVWSIGVNGTPASPEYAEAKHQVIKSTLTEIFGEKASEIPVLYGGSVNPGNANKLIIQPSIDGLFTGRSAWQAEAFDKLIRDAKATYESHFPNKK